MLVREITGCVHAVLFICSNNYRCKSAAVHCDVALSNTCILRFSLSKELEAPVRMFLVSKHIFETIHKKDYEEAQLIWLTTA